MIEKCYLCGEIPRYEYLIDRENRRSVQMICKRCHSHSMPKKSDPEAVKSWNDDQKAVAEILETVPKKTLWT